MSIPQKLLKWAIFSVALALLPLMFNYLRLLTRSQSPTLEGLVGSGELLLVASALSAAAVGDLLGSGRNRLSWKLLSGGGCIVVLCLTSLYFADVSSANDSEVLNRAIVAKTSQLFFAFAVLSGGSCIALAEV